MTNPETAQVIEGNNFEPSNYERPEGKAMPDQLTDEEIDKWWPIYDEPFQLLNEENPCRQSFNYEEFCEAMKSDTMAKLAYVADGEIASMVLLSNDFSHFPWLSEKFFQKKYPEEFDSGRIHYFVSFLTDPDMQQQGYGEKVLEFVTELFALEEENQIITFDCCDANSSWMPAMIAAIPESTGLGELSFENLGRQNYFAGRLMLNQFAQTTQEV